MEANHAEAAAPAAPPKPAKAKGNPLTDLIDSEKEYVDRLAGVIRVRSSYTLAVQGGRRSGGLTTTFTRSRNSSNRKSQQHGLAATSRRQSSTPCLEPSKPYIVQIEDLSRCEYMPLPGQVAEIADLAASTSPSTPFTLLSRN